MAEPFRGRGIGRRLASAIEAHCAKLACGTLYLYTHDAEEFYAAIGWQVVERFVDQGEPMVLMSRRLAISWSRSRALAASSFGPAIAERRASFRTREGRSATLDSCIGRKSVSDFRPMHGALAEWYDRHLGVGNFKKSIWRQEAGLTVFVPFSHNTDYFGRTEQQWMINFRVEDLDAAIVDLEASGIRVETRAEWDSDVGRFARIHDPEGNPIELWELSALARHGDAARTNRT